MSCFRTCNRRYQIGYVEAIRPRKESTPLRMGSAVHIGIDARAQGMSEDDAIREAQAQYAELPDWIRTEEDINEWQLEVEIVSRLLSGYFWRYSVVEEEIVATEMEFELPIINPETGRATPNYTFAGKIDKIVRRTDGVLVIREHKTTGESIDVTSDYWRRLRLDQQISGYMHAARALGHDVQTVDYDVIRKPSIRPKLVKGVRESIEQFGERLTADIAERPEFYYCRRDLARLDSDLAQFQQELWDTAQIIHGQVTRNRFPRNTASCVRPYRCQFLDICDRDLTEVPDGFVRVEDVHVELGGQLCPQ